ncbi:MAG: transcriptional regulator [Deltaproteobacteria bacterium]|nr:transcriptional regulator [Deltaproteobacteria bacterium]
MSRFALTAIGRDRAGIVEGVTEVLFEFNCNLEDSSMTILQDEFAIILIMTAPDDLDKNLLEENLKSVGEALKLSIHLKEIDDVCSEIAESTHMVTVSGYDKAGIVFKSTRFLAKWGINITDLSTRVIRGDDGDIYIMLLEVHFPPNIDKKAIEASLQTLGESLGVKIEVKSINLAGAL